MTAVQSTAAVPSEEASRFGGAFVYPGFRWFFGGLLLLSLGVWVSDVAQRWLVQELTGSPFFIGLISFSASLPILLFSLPGGVLADRVDRVNLIAGSRAVGGLLALGLALLTSLGQVEVWHVVLYAFTWGVVVALEIPARQALFPSLIPEKALMSGIAIYSGVWSTSTIAGPGIAGWLISQIGTAGCFYLTAAFYGLAVFFFLRLRPYITPAGRGDGAEREGAWASFTGGLRYIRDHQIVLALLVLALLPALFGQTASMALLPSFAADVLHGDASTFSLLLIGSGVGALAANVGLAVKANLERKGLLLVAFGVLFGAVIIALSQTTTLVAAAGILALGGAMSSCFMTLATTLVQTQVSDEMRGRVMSAYMLTWGMTSFGSLMMGSLGSAFGVPAAMAIGGALTMGSVVAVVGKVPELARLR